MVGSYIGFSSSRAGFNLSKPQEELGAPILKLKRKEASSRKKKKKYCIFASPGLVVWTLLRRSARAPTIKAARRTNAIKGIFDTTRKGAVHSPYWPSVPLAAPSVGLSLSGWSGVSKQELGSPKVCISLS